jgi:hypothetical protein
MRLRGGKRRDLGRFSLREGIVLKGKAVDAQGKPVAGIFLDAEKKGFDESLEGLRVADQNGRAALTNGQGDFEFAPLAPGSHRIHPPE